MTSNESSLGPQLRKLRFERGWTLAQASTRAGIGMTYLCELETGRERNPTLALLMKLARAYGTGIDRLCNFRPDDEDFGVGTQDGQ